MIIYPCNVILQPDDARVVKYVFDIHNYRVLYSISRAMAAQASASARAWWWFVKS